jgi:hypothetical protein
LPTVCCGWPQIEILLFSVSWVARNTSELKFQTFLLSAKIISANYCLLISWQLYLPLEKWKFKFSFPVKLFKI